MAAADSELVARTEAKAVKLVERRGAEVDAARNRSERDEAEYEKAKNRLFYNAFDVITGAVIYTIGALVAGFVLDVVGCMAIALATGNMNNEGSLTMTTLLPTIVLVVMVFFFAKTVSEKGKADRLKRAMPNDEEAVQLAQQRLESAKALQDRVRALSGRLRAETDDAELEVALSQLRRLERELDSELA